MTTGRTDRPSDDARLAAGTGAGRSSDYADGRAPRKAKHNNTRTDAPARAGANAAYWNSVPRAIAWILTHEETTRPMFTPEQWRVLVATWVVVDDYTGELALRRPPKGRAARVMLAGFAGTPQERRRLVEAIRDALKRAESIADVLYHDWRPAAHHRELRRRRRAGETLTGIDAVLAERALSDDERRVLQRFKRPRVGRKGSPSDPLKVGAEEKPGASVAFNITDDDAAGWLVYGSGQDS